MADEQGREIVDLRNERGEATQYETVASRLYRFREVAKYRDDFALLSEIIKDDGDSIVIKATIGFYSPTGTLIPVATGHSETFRDDQSEINRTATMEVTETSAWGRALAAFGFGSPLGLATQDEVNKAKDRAKELKQLDGRANGHLVELQNAAKKGMKELGLIWNGMSKADRKPVSKYMAKLRIQAAEVDDGKATTEAGRDDTKGVRGNASERGDVD